MSEFDDAYAFVDGFFAALATRVPQSASLKSSRDVVKRATPPLKTPPRGADLMKVP